MILSSGLSLALLASSLDHWVEVEGGCVEYSFLYRADIQRRGSILTWVIILYVYGADTIVEVKLLISPFLR
jgi:hypothetical protein